MSRINRFWFFFLLSISAAQAKAGTPLVLDYQVALAQNGSELAIAFQDRGDVSGVCDLFVKRMEYRGEIDVLIIEIEPSIPCLNDRMGKRKGSLRWIMPERLRHNGKFVFTVNDEVVGQIKIDQAKGTANTSSTR